MDQRVRDLESERPETGFRMPAEWEPHEATWISWPNFCSISYPFGLENVHAELLQAIRYLAQGERVFINISFPEEERWIRDQLGPETAQQVEFWPIPTCEPWNRDLGPTFTVNRARGKRGALDWGFNGWGGRFAVNHADARSKTQMAEAVAAEVFHPPLVLEGGALDTDGMGSLLCVTSSIATANRNPGRSLLEIEQTLRHWCGASKVLWLEPGLLEDETDGHIDTLGRFVAPGRIALVTRCLDESLVNPDLAQNYERLQRLTDARGNSLSVIELPPAQPLTCLGRVTPVTHANFYIGNSHVLVPAYGIAGDEAARSILAEHFPHREVVLLPSLHTAIGLGGIHCLTQQLPALQDSKT